MAPRSAVTLLPPEILTGLNSRLIDNAFSGYEALSEWLKSEGYEISKSAVHRHGSALQAAMEKSIDRARQRLEIAKAMGGMTNQEKASLLEASEMVAIDQLLDVLENLHNWEQADKAVIIPKLSRAIADIGRSSLGTAKFRKQFEAEIRAEEQRKKEQAATEAGQVAKKAGLSDDDWALIRAKFLGIDMDTA